MKKYLVIFIALLFAGVFPLSALAATGVGDGIVFNEQSSTPSTPESATVHLYFDTTATPVPKYVTDDGTVVTVSTSSATSLDGAYNGGAKIVVDGDAIELEVTDGANNGALYIDHNEATNDNTAFLLENAANAANAISIDIDAQTTGRDIEGTGASWYVTGEGNLTVNNMAIGGTLDVTGATTLSGAIYQAAIAAAASGNVALTVNAAGNGTIAIGDVSTGAVTITPATTIVGATTLTGALTANGACTLGNAATDDITVTGDVVADIRLDDDTTNSPAVQWIDAGEYDWAIVKVNGATGNLTCTSDAATSDFQIVTGNLKVGSGTEGVTLDGQDAYVTGTFEVDGATQLDGAASFNGTTAFTGATNTFTLGAAEYVKIDASTTAQTQTDGALDINFGSITSATSAININVNGVTAGGGSDIITGICFDVDDDTNAASELSAIIIDSTDVTGSSEVWGIAFQDTAGAATGVEECIHAEVPAGGKYLVLDAATVDSTQTAGVMDIDFDTLTTAAMALNLKTTLLASAGAGVEVTGMYLDVDDDSDSASTVTAITIDSTDATGSSEVRGIAFETIAGADTLLDTCIFAETDADTVVLSIDANGTAHTGTAGVIDAAYNTITDTASFFNLDMVTGDAAGVVATYGFLVDLDDDTSTAAATIRGYAATSSDLTGNASTLVQGFYSSGCDVAAQFDNGYVRIGTGSTPGITPGDDDLYVEGTAEVDGELQADGSIDANSTILGEGTTSTYIEGMTSQVETYIAAGNTLTIAESGRTFVNTGDTDGTLHTLPEASTAIGCEYTFVVIVAQNVVINPYDATDAILGLTDAGGDSITSAGIGDSITLFAASADGWVVKSCNNSNGNADAWADTN